MSVHTVDKRWKVRKSGSQVSEHKHYDQAEAAARDSGATSVYYWNGSLGVTVWEAPEQELTYR